MPRRSRKNPAEQPEQSPMAEAATETAVAERDAPDGGEAELKQLLEGDDAPAATDQVAAESAEPEQQQELEEEVLLAPDLKAPTLAGDIRDAVWQEMGLHKLSEFEQRRAANRITRLLNAWLREAVQVIASGDRPTVRVGIKQVTVTDDEIKAVLTVAKDAPDRHALFDSPGSPGMLTVASSAPYMGERAPVKIVPDQTSLLDKAGVVHSAPDGVREPDAPAPDPVPEAAAQAEGSAPDQESAAIPPGAIANGSAAAPQPPLG